MINWDRPDEMVSHYFSVHECLYLPSWQRYAKEEDGLTDEIKNSLYALCNKMDEVRNFMGAPLIVHCCYRPEAYNTLVNGAKNSPHMRGEAMDFHVEGLEGPNYCDHVREVLQPSLENLDMRMEDLPLASWIHMGIDKIPDGGHRFFKP